MEKFVVFENNEGLIGDFLCTLPFMQEYCEQHQVTGILRGGYNTWVFRALKNTNLFDINSINDSGIANSPIISLSCSQSWQNCFYQGSTMHMCQGHGYGIDISVPYTKLEFHERAVECYAPGFILAPYSRTDDNGSKCWPAHRWAKLAEHLMKTYARPVYMFGHNKYDCFEPYQGTGIIPMFNLWCEQVVWLLKNCEAAITVDTGISHLAHFLGINNHVLLYPNASPKKFAENPNSITLYGEPKDITVDQMIEAVRSSQFATFT